MKTFIKKSLLVCSVVLLFLSSCVRNDFDEIISNESNSEYVENNILNFQYKGEFYKSSYMKDGASIILSDAIADKVYSELINLPNLVAVIDADNSIDYYDDYLDYENQNELITGLPAQTTIMSAQLELYQHTKYSGKMVMIKVYNTFGKTAVVIPDLSVLGINDWISSLKIKTTVWSTNSPETNFKSHQCEATLYEHKNYEGASISWSALFHDVYVKNFRDVPVTRPFPYVSPSVWNEIASSLRFRIYYPL